MQKFFFFHVLVLFIEIILTPKKHDKLTKDFYYKEEAEIYSNSKWMAKNQIETSQRVLQLLEDERIGGLLDDDLENFILLDLGCGSGFSSLIFLDYDARLIGVDLSFDMLSHNLEHQIKIEQLDNKKQIKKILINASINALPLRNNTIKHIISISAFNFILDDAKSKPQQRKIMDSITQRLNKILKSEGRVVIEFYPKKENLDIYMNSLKKYFNGSLVIDNPGLRKEKKYLILRKEN